MSSEGHQHGGQPCDPSEAAAFMDTAEYGLSCLGCGQIGTPSTVHEPTGIYLCAERCVPALAAQPAAGEGLREAAAIVNDGIRNGRTDEEIARAILAAQPAAGEGLYERASAFKGALQSGAWFDTLTRQEVVSLDAARAAIDGVVHRAAQPATGEGLREAADYACRSLDAAIGAAECGYVPSKAVQEAGRDAARALRAALRSASARSMGERP